MAMGYQAGQSLIGHLHFLSEYAGLDPCEDLGTDFADKIASIERDPSDQEENSAMI